MVIRNLFLTVLFGVLFLHSIIAQDETTYETTSEAGTDETTLISNTTTVLSTTPPVPITTAPPPITSCYDRGEFPLFGDDTCISRATYTAIFLTSIILAGISFIMLIGLLIWCCIQQSRDYESSYGDDDVESNNSKDSVGKKSNLTATRSVGRGGGQRSGTIGNVTGTTPLEDNPRKLNRHRSPDNYYSPADDQVPPSPSSAPYTAPKPPIAKRPRPADQKPTENIEMTSHLPTTNPSRTQPTAVPKPAPRPDGRSGKNRSNTVVAEQENETSYF